MALPQAGSVASAASKPSGNQEAGSPTQFVKVSTIADAKDLMSKALRKKSPYQRTRDFTLAMESMTKENYHAFREA